jgi:hypothetical protein
MPFAENERRLRRDHHRQRRGRALLAQPVHQVARIVFVLDRPAESHHAPGQPGKPVFQVPIHA